MRLHTYFQSGTAHRVRIALGLKGLDWEGVYVHLLRGDQKGEAYRALNPEGLVPLLETDGARISQSLAIIEYLDAVHPEPRLIPADPLGAARVRSLALIAACDMHPLANLRVLKYLKNALGIDGAGREAWGRHWMEAGLGALEARLAAEPETGRFCHGDAPTLADVCLVPQVLGARRWGVRTDAYPTVARVFEAAQALEAFAAAMPERQPDAEAPR